MKKQLLTFAAFATIAGSMAAQQNRSRLPQFNTARAVNHPQLTNTVTGTPGQKKNLEWKDAAFDTVSRNLYVYDSKKRLVSDIEQSKKTGAYTDSSKVLLYYAPNNTTAYYDSIVIFTLSNNVWERVAKGTVTYQDLSKGLPKEEEYVGDELTFGTKYYYDNNNFIKYSISSFALGPIGGKDSSVYTVDSKGNALTIKTFSKTTITPVYAPKSYEVNTYDANNNLLTHILQEADISTGSGFSNKERNSYTYNASGNVTSVLDESWDDTTPKWDNAGRTTTFYKNVTEYDYQLVEKWDGSIWENDLKFIWNGDGTSNIITHKANANGIGVYPNPAADKATVYFNLNTEQLVNITIADINGKQVAVIKNEKMAAGAHTLSAELKDLAKGFYFVKLNLGNAQAVQKLIIQ